MRYLRPWRREREADKLGIPFLGGVPLHMEIREKSDAGQPIVATNPDGQLAQAYRDIAARAWQQLEESVEHGLSHPSWPSAPIAAR